MSDSELREWLDRLERKINLLLKIGGIEMALLDDAITDATAQTTVIGSAVTLLGSLSASLAAAGTDPTKLATLKNQIDANTATLAAALVANTPGAPAPAAALQQANAAVAAAS